MNTQTTHILLIEDNPGDVRLIAEQLKEDNSSHYELHSEGRLKAGCTQCYLCTLWTT